MIAALNAALPLVAGYLASLDGWQRMYVGYHEPYVQRLWRPWPNGGRMFVHRILLCEPGDALIHNHEWPSAMLILSGGYAMDVYRAQDWREVAKGATSLPRTPAVTLHLPAGSMYEMNDREAFHAVYPISAPSLSIMLIGPKWSADHGQWTTYPHDRKPTGAMGELDITAAEALRADSLRALVRHMRATP